MKRMTSIMLATCVVGVLAGCGKEAIPTERLGRAEGAVRSARETGAEGEPTAALHLRLAQDNLKRAKMLIDKGENERARYLLMRSEADADLARTLNDESKAKQLEQRSMSDLANARNAPAGTRTEVP